jgi:hypothetical protein
MYESTSKLLAKTQPVQVYRYFEDQLQSERYSFTKDVNDGQYVHLMPPQGWKTLQHPLTDIMNDRRRILYFVDQPDGRPTAS